MSWRERIQPGSFRGVTFFSDAADGEVGRRVVLHEYPGRDKPYSEDLGRKARKFTLEIYVFGVDYMAARDALIAAFEEAGPGRLMHPYRGEMSASVLEVRGPRESTREGGMARFSVTFVEGGEASFPAAEVDGGEIVSAAADDAAAAVQEEFAEQFDVSGPAWIAEEAVGLVDSISNQIAAIKDAIPSLPEAVTGFVSDLQGLSVEAESLIRTPAGLGGQIYGLVADLVLLPDRPLRALDSYRQLWDVLNDAPAVSESTPSRTRQAANQAALASLVQRAAVVEAARAVAVGGVDFASYQEAIAARDELAEQLDLQMETAGDAAYATLAGLRAELVRYVAANAGDLARLVSYTPAATLPALVIAHRLYGDATQAEEIVARNNLRHPGFVPGGAPLEVLSNV